MFRPNLVLVRKILLRVPQIGISCHLQIYDATVLSRFFDTHVFVRSASVKCQEILEGK